MKHTLRWFVGRDENYYPNIELFDDYDKALEYFKEIVQENENNDWSSNTHDGVEYPPSVHLGIVFLTHLFGEPLDS